MTAETLLADLTRRGIWLTPNGDKLTVEPASKLTDADRQAIRAHKHALVAYLRARTLARKAEAQGHDLADYLREQTDLLDEPRHCQITPAESLVSTCRRHNIALRLDDNGMLVVNCEKATGLTPSDWRALKNSLEAHLEIVAKLVAAGWHLQADVKATAA